MKNRLRLISFGLTCLLTVLVWGISKNPTVNKRFLKLASLKNQYVKLPLDLTRLNSELDLNRGEIHAFPAVDSETSFRATYLGRTAKPEVRFFSQGTEGTLSATSNKKSQLGHVRKSEWYLALKPGVVQTLSLEALSGRGVLDLTGLSVENLSFHFKSGSIKLKIDKPNPVSMRMLKVEGGAVNLVMTGLSNAQANQILIDSEAGKSVLDFSGDQKTSTQLHLEGTVVKSDIVIPKTHNVRLRFGESEFADVSVEGFTKISDDEYHSHDFDPKAAVLDIFIELSAGKVSVRTN